MCIPKHGIPLSALASINPRFISPNPLSITFVLKFWILLISSSIMSDSLRNFYLVFFPIHFCCFGSLSHVHIFSQVYVFNDSVYSCGFVIKRSARLGWLKQSHGKFPARLPYLSVSQSEI